MSQKEDQQNSDNSGSEETKQPSFHQQAKRKQKPNMILYFTNRLEVGLNSVYEKLEQCAHVLHGTQNSGDYEEFRNNSKFNRRSTKFRESMSGNYQESADELDENDITGYITRIKVKGLDRQGREQWHEEGKDELSVTAASIKMVNIPSMFDLGISPVNPSDQQLNLNIIDDITYHEVIEKKLKKDCLMHQWKIENTKAAIEAIHHNLFCSEVEIIFDGYSTKVNDTRCLWNMTSRKKVRETMKNMTDSIDPITEASGNMGTSNTNF